MLYAPAATVGLKLRVMACKPSHEFAPCGLFLFFSEIDTEGARRPIMEGAKYILQLRR